MVRGLRRLAIAILLCVGLTALGASVIGLIICASLDRSLVLGFYLVGCFLRLAGFFVGNRGPARVKSEEAGAAATPLGVFSGSRPLRWATLGEQEDTINSSAVFVTLGIILVAVG